MKLREVGKCITHVGYGVHFIPYRETRKTLNELGNSQSLHHKSIIISLFTKTTIVQCYAPKEDAANEDRHVCYTKLKKGLS